MNAIEMKGLTKRYRDVIAVDELSLTVQSGELFALLGVNGAGKTTTIKMLCGLTVPDAGDAFLMGKSVVKEPQAVKQIIGVSPQETAVAPNLTVRENLELMAGLFNSGKAQVDALLSRLGLNEVEKKRAGKLSGGYARRLSIAMALIGKPQILFLDEPTLGLDVIARSELWDLIRSLKQTTTVILTTHYMEEAEQLSDRIGIMKQGRLLTVGTVDEMKKKACAERFEDAFVRIVKEEMA